MEFSKPPITVDQQIQHLLSKGLEIPNLPKAKHQLTYLSYYRLKPYLLAFFRDSELANPLDKKVDFDAVLQLYQFDRNLRMLVFDAIEQIEIALRASINNHLSLAYGAHWYSNPSLFDNPQIFRRTISEFKSEIHRSKEKFIQHYRAKYTVPKLPPSWMALEVASFGRLSNTYKNLNPTRPVKDIAANFQLKKPKVLASWIHLITIIRNICAHHGRLWNRVFTQTPAIPRHPFGRWPHLPIFGSQPRIYAGLVCILYLLRSVNPYTDFASQIVQLTDEFPAINTMRMGFPRHWQNDMYWSDLRASSSTPFMPLNTATSNTAS